MAITQLPLVPSTIQEGIRITKNTDKNIYANFGVDLTNATVTLEVRRSNTALDILLTKFGAISIPASNGDVVFNFVPTDTVDIASGFYVFNITITSPTLGTLAAVTGGQFLLEPFDQFLVGQIEPIMVLGLTKSTERSTLEIQDRNGVFANPAELTVEIFDDSDSQFAFYTFPSPGITNLQAGLFYTELLSNRAGDFLVVWRYRFTGDEQVTIIKNLRFVTPAMFRLMPEVRLFIDKARKASDRPIAFNPIDIAVYLENALRDFNAWSPVTNFVLDNVANPFKGILIQGAVIQSLIAQGLLAVDQDFQYNDNGISLVVDHSTKLMAWYSVLLADYITKKKNYKWSFMTGTVLARTVIGSAFSLGLAKVPASTLSRFRGWI